MTEKALKDWLKQEQPVIEKIILEAAKRFVAEQEQSPNFSYDLSIAHKEVYNLSDGKDLCYDRFTTPLVYSLWYQAKRINVFASLFSNKIIEAFNSSFPIEIFDLGAGTGCVQFCFGLAYVGHIRHGSIPSLIRFINVDLSPFMLNYLRSYLWPVAAIHYPELKNLPIEYHVYSWTNNGDLMITNPWICASYLFDSSDNEDYLKSNFEELINTFDPAKIMFLTSSQSSKLTLMNGLAAKMKNLNYRQIPTHKTSDIFNGVLSDVDVFRKSLIDKYNLKKSTYSVSWNDRSFAAVGMEKLQTGIIYNTRVIPQHLDLFNPPMKIRRDVQLSDEQKNAALYEERPSIITGPAGCGKSVVVTEKIINILEHYQWLKNLNILVTTFNKGLIKQLRAWLTDLLEVRNIEHKQKYYLMRDGDHDGTGEITIGEQFIIKIKFVHFEMLGKYIGGIAYGSFNEATHKGYLEKVVKKVRAELSIGENEMEDILSAEFLLEEYHRVIYGLSCKLRAGEEVYQNIERKGRGKKPQLLYNSQRRQAIWIALYQYAQWMHRDPSAGKSFIARRQLFLNLLESNTFTDKFDYVFVDEFQDCTNADYRIMSLMLKDVNNLVLAGDLAQAVHIGQSGTIPRDGDMSRRKYHKLKGSYRLPYRISEALSPLSQHITNSSADKEVTVEITPYKGAPPGARPIIVYATDEANLAGKIIQIKNNYSFFDLQRITILEKDDLLCRAIFTQTPNVETSTILRLKGLEKEFVVWSLQADILFENEVNEFAYTIMTRTNCLLIIAITPQHKKYCLDLVYLLKRDRLIFWDSETDDFFLANMPDSASNSGN